MPPFLPVQGLERSKAQNVRIGGQTLQFGVTTYVDLGMLAIPSAPTQTNVENSASTPGLEKETNFYWVVTANDAFGGETTPSGELKAETGKGTNASGANHNVVTVKWLAVPNATSYNVYRGTASGKEELVVSGVEALKYEDVGKAVTATTPPTANNTFYNSGKGAYSPKAELKQHAAIGAFVVVGPLTATNSEWVVTTGTGLAVTTSNLEVKVAAGELRNRSTGQYLSVSAGTSTLSAASGTEDRTDLVVVNTTTGAVEKVAGTLAAVGKSVAPAVPAGTVPVGAFLVAKSATVALWIADLRPRN